MERSAEIKAPGTTTYLAQFKDWGGEWCDDGRVFSTVREARDGCIGMLADRGYSGSDVRVLRRTVSTVVEVVVDPCSCRSVPDIGGGGCGKAGCPVPGLSASAQYVAEGGRYES